MRKIKRFKITPRQKEILRRLLRGGGLLRQAGFTTELEVTKYILEGFATLNPGVVYEFNQDAHWELDNNNAVHKEMFSACAVTLGPALQEWVEKAKANSPAREIVAGTVALEFLKSAVSFVTDLVREQAEKEEYEALETMINKLSTKKAIENLYVWWTDYVMLNDLEKIKIVTYRRLARRPRLNSCVKPCG